jgi:tetratricopeptide (TPR) repeat protein
MNIFSYTENARLVLAEAGKYFALLVFSVLAIRLWRRYATVPASRNAGGLLAAGVATALAVAIGYFSMCQSLGIMNCYYGKLAFQQGRVPQSLNLFEQAGKYWNNADAVGGQGVCRLMSGDAENGLALIAEARRRRRAKETPFEDFYEGVYRFNEGDVKTAVPLLESASTDYTYRWSVIKLFIVMALDENNVAHAAEKMRPFMQAEVTEFDQAYIVASLKLAEGKKDEARRLLDKFRTTDLPPVWQKRYAKLREKLQE